MTEGACQPDWSPSGSRLVFISPCIKRQEDYPNTRLYTINADGSELTELPIPGGGFEPAWSPDGRRIAFTSSLSGLDQIHLFDLGNNLVTALTEKMDTVLQPDRSHHPAWSPTGAQIVYTGHSQLTGAEQIWVMSDSGQDKTRLVLTDVSYWNFQPDWGSDGRAIYFSETIGAQELGWLMQFDYDNRENPDASQVLNGNYATDVSISPDLLWLAFESTRYGDIFNVYLMRNDGSNRARLTNEPDEEFDPVWRPSLVP
jgi:Tol biopolymer transport system component